MATASLTRPTATASEFDALDQFPAANVRKPGDFPESEFVNVSNVPVFAEHETVTRDGKPIKFGRDELAKIVERCNRRIEDTGDYAAITAGHTPSPEAAERGAEQPDVLGYAGPFRLGVLGLKDGGKRWAILADEHVFKDEYPRWRKLSRRSPEVWLEDRFEEMFLDPIAHLGAEAPRLDMGLLYAAERSGRRVERYAAVAAASPSASSVFIPSQADVGRRRRYAEGDSGFSDAVPVQQPARDKRESEETSMLQSEDIEQIVDAIDRLPWVGAVKQMLQQQAAPGPGAMTPGVETAGADVEGSPPAGGGGERRASPESPPPAPAKDAAATSGATDFPSAPQKFEAAAAADDRGERADERAVASEEERREREEYSRLHKKYGAGAEQYANTIPGNKAMWAQVDDAGKAGKRDKEGEYDRAQMDGEWHSRYAKEEEEKAEREEYARLKRHYAADGNYQRYSALQKKYGAGDADSQYREAPAGATRESIEIPAGGAKVEKNARRYAADGSADGSNPNKPAEGNADEGNNRPGEGTANIPGDAPADPYARNGHGREQYARQADVLRYQRENQELRGQLDDLKRRGAERERYARLQDLRGRFAFDFDKALEITKYGKMSDADFEAHCEFIASSSREIPLGSYLPGSDDVPEAGPTNGQHPGRRGPAEKYSRAVSDRAREICEQAAVQGKTPNYEAVVRDLAAGRQPVI